MNAQVKRSALRATLIPILLVTTTAALRAQAPPPGPAWQVSAGVGALVAPTHVGSDELRVLPFPIVAVTYRDRVYLGPSASGLGGGLGVRLVHTQRMDVAAEVGMLENRPADRSDVLAGTANRDVLGSVGASLSYRAGPVESTLSVTQGINDNGGLVGRARVGYTRMLGQRLIASLDGSASFANARQMRREFGVTESESIRRMALIAAGDPRLRPDEGRSYRPGADLTQIGTSMSLTYVLTQQVAVFGFGGADRLSDEAAASPLVRERAQFSGGLGLIWRP